MQPQGGAGRLAFFGYGHEVFDLSGTHGGKRTIPKRYWPTPLGFVIVGLDDFDPETA